MDSQFRLRNESLFVLAEAPGGVYNAEQLRAVCDIVKSSSSFMKLTSEQSLGLMVEAEGIPALQSQLAKVGLLLKPYRLPQSPGAKSCLGSLCPESQQDALGDAINLSETLSSQEGLGHFAVGITLNGCSRSCVAGATDDLHLIAEETGYKVSIGGRNAELAQLGQLVAENVLPEKLPELIGRILELYGKERQDEESLFDTIERTGIGIFVEAAGGEPSAPLDLMSELPNGDALEDAEGGASEDFASMTLPAPELPSTESDFSTTGDDASLATAGTEPGDAATLPSASFDEVPSEPAVDLDFGHDTGSEPAFEFEAQSSLDGEVSGSALLAGLPQPGQYDASGNEIEDPAPALPTTALESPVAPTPHLKLAAPIEENEFLSDFSADDIESADELPAFEAPPPVAEELLSDAESAPSSADAQAISEIPLESFEEEFATDADLAAQGLGSDAARFAKAMTDLDKPIASGVAGDAGEALSEQQVNALLADEGNLELSEATDEDLSRVTQSIRSEGSFERDFERLSAESAKPYAAGVSPVASPTQPPPAQTPAPQAPARASGGSSGRFRVRTAGGQLELSLPTGVELQIPIESFAEGEPFEMETEDGTVTIERVGNALKVKFGGLCMGVPVKSAA